MLGKFQTYLGQLFCYWVNVHYCILPNTGKIIYQSGHTAHEPKSLKSHPKLNFVQFLDEEEEMVAGQCHCKLYVDGARCDRCKNGYWNFTTENTEGCQGSLNLQWQIMKEL